MMVEHVRADKFEQAPRPPSGDGADRRAARKRRLKRGGGGIALIAAIALAGVEGWHYWTVGRFVESTDDAYVTADYTTISAKVPGYISQVLVSDNQKVKAGTLLARIDDRDYQAALNQAKAGADAASVAVTNISAQMTLQSSVVLEAEATLTAARAALTLAVLDDDRAEALTVTGTGAKSRSDQTRAARAQAKANVAHSEAALAAAREKVRVLETERLKAQAESKRADAVLQQARLNLSYTRILAPIDGTVGARSLRLGQLVNTGTQLMAIVPLHKVYVVANFKETQLTDMRPGQPATIHVDSFPNLRIRGHVQSLAPAAGQEFSLLPPDNATGNFTKVVQRVPVKIAIDAPGPDGLLRAGMSVEPEVDTRSAIN